MGRAPCCDKANVKRGPWSPEEDAKLKSYIEKHGTGGNWIALPQKIGLKRCGKSCRLRWLNYLRPNIKHGGFTEDEDNLICNLYISIGSRWSIIAAQLPGRTDNDIKNYWNTRLKKKLLGKQRREQQVRRGSCSTKQLENTKRECNENYSTNECFGLYPPQRLSLVGYTNQETPVYEKMTNSLVDTSLMQSSEAKLANYVDHYQPKTESFGNFRYISDVHYSQNPINRLAPSTSTALLNNSYPQFPSNFQAYGEIPEEIMYSMPQNLDGVDSFSSLDLINSSAITTVSHEDTHLGDITSLIYPSALPNFETCQPKMTQEWIYLDEPRLLGYS